MSSSFPQPGSAGLLEAARDGSLPAAHALVERYQRDILTTAYLLTGDPSGALDLARRTLLRFFDELQSVDPDDDPYPWLLRLLAREAREPTIPPVSTMAASDAGRYRVDDERSRLRDALALLDLPARLGLVLVDFAGLPPGDLDGTIDSEGDAGKFAERLPAVRRRVEQAANLDTPGSLAAGLRTLTVEAPRVALWEELEPDVAALFARRRVRARGLALGVGGVVALLVLTVVGLLVYGALDGDDDDARSGALPAATATRLATRAPTPIPAYEPLGDVPDMLLYEAEQDSSAPLLGLYDPASRADMPLPGRGAVTISPDGATLLQLETRREPDRLQMHLVASASADGRELWRADIGTFIDSGPRSAFPGMVVVGATIYVASYDPAASDGLLSLTIVGLADGALREHRELDLGVDLGAPGVEVDVFGVNAPLPPALTILVRSLSPAWTKIQQLDLRDGTVRIDSEPAPDIVLPSGRLALVPDGRAVLSLPASGMTESLTIPFLTLDTLTRGEIGLPFQPTAASTEVLVEYVFSHDGRRLHAFAPYQSRVAVIDLELRQVERAIDLTGAGIARSYPAAIHPQALAELYRVHPAALSTDGRSLYALGPLEPLPDGGYSASIWNIDIATWQVVDTRVVGAPDTFASLHARHDGADIYLHTAGAENGERQFVGFEAVDRDAAQPAPDLRGRLLRGTLADLYRETYGRSPAIAGVAPRDNRAFTTIPTVDVEIDSRPGPVGWNYELRVTLRDPVTGRPVDAGAPGLRYAAPGALTATFRNGDERRVAVLGPSGTGTYTGRLALDLPGYWDLTLAADGPSGDGWSVARPAAVEVTDTVTDSAGREYVLQVTTDPARAVAGEQLALTVTFKHINSGLVLPSSDIPSSAELNQALPDTLTLTLSDGTVITLNRAGSIHYTALARFPSPGVHFPTITYIDDRGLRETTTARVEVAAPN